MDLVLVESPAKAKTINKYLGKGYEVLASFGHVRDLPAKSGDIVVLDVGAIFEGYVSDNRRLAHIGKVEDDLRKLNATMAEIVVQTGMSAAPGVSFGDLCIKAEQLHKERGLPPMFLSAGHTIGIQTEETWISKGSNVKFGEGVLFNIELY